jgi:hypothetical protein
MPNILRFFIFAAAVALFVTAAFTDGRVARGGKNFSLTAAGLALFATPFMIDAMVSLDQ